MAEEQKQNPALKWAINLGGAYLGISLAVKLFLYPDNQMYDDSINKCGKLSAFCACQAQALVDQYTILNAPLWIIGTYKPRNAAAQCADKLN